jgi:hypothetical protein
MVRFLSAVIALGVFGVCGLLRAEDSGAAPSAVIDKAIQATGGEALLSKYKAATWKSKGTFYGMGQPIPYTAEWTIQWPDKSKATISGEFNDQKFAMTNVYNHDKAWMKMNEQAMEMDGDHLAAAKDEMHARRVSHLLELKDPGYKLSALPEAKVDGKAAVGVKVSSAGHRDVSLYFDKDSGLLVKSEMRIKNPDTSEEANQETFYSDYKDIQGAKEPMKITVKRDGKVFTEGENSDMKLLEQLDDKVFAEPKQ